MDSSDQLYTDPDWLREAVFDVLRFYYPTCVDEDHGGFIAQLDPKTGTIYDPASKHLVATCRFVVNFATGARLEGPSWCKPMASRGVRFLREAHYDDAADGYDWLLDGRDPVEKTRKCYGHAFVLLAYARAAAAGVDDASSHLEHAVTLLEDRFWEPVHDLYRSEWSADWTTASTYRGQNANMHACEALIAAYETTEERQYLDRALAIAQRLTVELAEETDGLVWEHFTSDWSHDFAYNRENPEDKFRPWGYQPGHQVEWAKLLATLDRFVDTEWLLDRAEALFDTAVELGWDDSYGGFYYTVDRDGAPIITDKYRWPVAEAIGAAAVLYDRTGEDRYREWYERFWEYATVHLVTAASCWRHRLTRTNEPYDHQDGPEVEPGYHPIGACYESLWSFSGDYGLTF